MAHSICALEDEEDDYVLAGGDLTSSAHTTLGRPTLGDGPLRQKIKRNFIRFLETYEPAGYAETKGGEEEGCFCVLQQCLHCVVCAVNVRRCTPCHVVTQYRRSGRRKVLRYATGRNVLRVRPHAAGFVQAFGEVVRNFGRVDTRFPYAGLFSPCWFILFLGAPVGFQIPPGGRFAWLFICAERNRCDVQICCTC